MAKNDYIGNLINRYVDFDELQDKARDILRHRANAEGSDFVTDFKSIFSMVEDKDKLTKAFIEDAKYALSDDKVFGDETDLSKRDIDMFREEWLSYLRRL